MASPKLQFYIRIRRQFTSQSPIKFLKMKKSLASLISGIIFSLLTTTSKAQTLSVSNEGTLNAASSHAALSKANSKAQNNFRKNFADGPDVKWFTEKETISASMNRDNKHTTVVYDKKGRWLRTMSNYDESKLPKDVRRTVKSVYYDYNITLVQEIKEGQITFYVIHLEDKTSYKQVAVYEGEITILNEFNKQS